MKPWIFSDQDRTETTLAAVAADHFKVKDGDCLNPLGPISSFQHYDSMMLMFL